MLTEQKHHTMRNATMSCLGTMWVLAVLLLCGCSRTSEFRARLMALDSVLVQHPDSVYDVMVRMETEAHGQSQSDRMYYELLRADAQNKAYVDFTTDSVMAEVADWYDRHGTPNEQMRAHYLLGCTYRDMKDVPMELQCFQDAVEKADTTARDCDLYTLYAIYGQMADIYHSQYLPEEELKTLAICERIAWMDKDTLSAIQAHALQARTYDLIGENDSTLKILNQAYDHYLYLKDTINASRLLGSIISLHIGLNKWNQVKMEMDTYEKQTGYFDNEGELLETSMTSYYYIFI